MKELSLNVFPPASKLPYPDGLWNRTKYLFWRAISYPFPYVRDILVGAHIIHHDGRQNYLLGKLKSTITLETFLSHLRKHGFGNHFIAWRDDGQLISLRRLDGFDHQYHLRIFKDGEIRGHYEFTPESHPLWHRKDVGAEPRREEFLQWIQDWIVPSAAKQETKQAKKSVKSRGK